MESIITCVTGRRWGKTTEMIKLAEEKGCHVVTHNEAYAKHLRAQYPDFPYDFIFYREMIRITKYSKCKFIIDNMDLVLGQMFNKRKIVGFSMTGLRHPLSLKEFKHLPHYHELNQATKQHPHLKQEFLADFKGEDNGKW
jgi:hypothetical protein